MTDVFVVSDNIFSPLGSTTAENFSRLQKAIPGVRQHERPAIFDSPFYASLFEPGQPIHGGPYTKFEQLLLASIGDAIQRSDIDPADKKTILIISSTKGNISLLESGTHEPASISLPVSARKIAAHFRFAHDPIVVSNACISGVLALLLAKRLLQSGQYENAVVAGADVISRFVLSGFGSFQAISPGPCKPFDAARDGINLGEGRFRDDHPFHPAKAPGRDTDSTAAPPVIDANQIFQDPSPYRRRALPDHHPVPEGCRP